MASSRKYPPAFTVASPHTTATGRTTEQGSSGLQRTGGYITEEPLQQLRGISGAKIFQEMAKNDPLMSAMMYAIEMLLRQATWDVEPAGKDAESRRLADLVREQLMEKMHTPWPSIIAEACSMLTYGYAPMEVVYERTESGLILPSKIALRSQLTVQRWEFDVEGTGEVVGLWQQDWINPAVFIPIEKLLLFRTTPRLNNPEGNSLLRGSYRSWVRKNTVEEAEGRAALRAAGVVLLRIPAEIIVDESNKGIYDSYKTLATSLANDRQGSVILPSDVNADTKVAQYNLEYVVADGRRPADMSPIVERYDKRIATTVMADFLLLGQQAVGSFALSSDKTALFSTAIGAFLDTMQSVFDREMLRRCWAYNGLDPKLKPKLVHGDVESPDLAELSTYISTLAGVGMPLFPDEDLERHMRRLASLPEPKPGDSEARQLAAATQAAGAGFITDPANIPQPTPPAGAGGGA